jgi:ribosomal-protein-alanine N-acetyltransferase
MLTSHMGAEVKREIQGVAIRALLPADGARVAKILEEAPEAANWSRESLQRSTNSPGGVTLVSEAGGEISGFLLARQVVDEGEVLNLAVVRARRRQGDGGALLKAALEQFVDRGVSRVFLEVRESNEAGIAFYSKHGFVKTGRRAAYYHDSNEAAIMMEKKLGGQD